jgi:hypothetical protein
MLAREQTLRKSWRRDWDTEVRPVTCSSSRLQSPTAGREGRRENPARSGEPCCAVEPTPPHIHVRNFGSDRRRLACADPKKTYLEDLVPGPQQTNGDTNEHGDSFNHRGGSPVARIVVMTDKQDCVLLDEYVRPVHIEDEHASLQVLERLAWAIMDASHREQYALGK